MPTWLFIVVNMLIAAFVGGITNHFAIQMLFHPRTEWRFLGRRVPFTPGIIPKRKPEIAASLGDVVASYLVTPEGLQELLAGEQFRLSTEERIARLIEEIAGREPGLTVRDLAVQWFGEENYVRRKTEFADYIREGTSRGLAWLWQERGLGNKRLSELFPGWSEERTAEWSEKAADIVVSALTAELLSAEGQRMLRKLTAGLIDRSSGFLGALAAMFVDEDKLVSRLTPVLVEQLEGENVRGALRSMIRRQIDAAGERTLEQLAAIVSGEEEPLPWLARKLEEALPLERLFEAAERIDVSCWLRDNRPLWQGWLKRLVNTAGDLLVKHMRTIIQALSLPQVVRQQVEKFPVERLETIVLSVSGKEFKAITWLGVLLGGIIGLIQSVLMIWFG
jgi:uncharacterized membrane protein YheB (UPF0754 family)